MLGTLKEIRASVKTTETQQRGSIYILLAGHVERDESKSEDHRGVARPSNEARFISYELGMLKEMRARRYKHRQAQQRRSVYILLAGHVERDESKCEDDRVVHINAVGVGKLSKDARFISYPLGTLKEMRASVKTTEAGHVKKDESKCENDRGVARPSKDARFISYGLGTLKVIRARVKTTEASPDQQTGSIYILLAEHVERDESKSEDDRAVK
ncbi:hypothetical protein EDD21DRAFT_358135 [Dissophora ornata]|nr:hypothetical protein EDD21DRAFT_358135 [Dissophora ornata]